MRAALYILSAALITTSLPHFLSADESHGAVHIVLPDGEEDIEDGCCELVDPEEERGMPERPWYQNQKFEVFEDNGDPTDYLEEDTAWPGQREEFSDILFR
ncbi:MAG: hypothetical protein WCF65_04115 [Parachlamydiaceae bacterium]